MSSNVKTTMFSLHEVVLPASRDDENLFVQWIGSVARGAARPFRLEVAQGFRTDTYFGVFALGHWRRIAALDDLVLRFRGSGRCRYAVKTMATAQAEDEVLQQGIVEIAGEAVVDLNAIVSQAAPPSLYLEILAVTDTCLESLAFATRQTPVRHVDLGLVVTTFNRTDDVRETIDKLHGMLARDPEREIGTMRLVIVDNGRDLDPDDFPDITVLANANLGGAGGFARGLAHLQDLGSATHGCFMDDDAATTEESLFRVRRLLAYATDPQTAVSGAMLRAEHRARMHEQGAMIEWGRGHRIISRKHGLDLLDRRHLLHALEPETVGYGGWWLFAFPIGRDIVYPYPVFVRGDDWLFSYLNAFTIEVMPGICSWQAGFETKISPTEQYLAFKAFLVAELLLRTPTHRAKTIYFFGAWLLRNLFGYCYDRAALNCEALSDVLEGPEFWARNASLGGRLAALKPLVTTERLRSLDPQDVAMPFAHMRWPERRARTWVRVLTLNGHLVPLWLAGLVVQPVVAVPQLQAPHPVAAFLRRTIIYRTPGKQAFVAARDTGRLLQLFVRSCILLVRLFLAYSNLRTRYAASVERLCTQGWWNQKFADELAVIRGSTER
jgi:galactofuranosylgalactofuranosylrhamnosyl-N-acetylglucosaminyl-diphospho-decaprenol beta-1,5/1,6-galactofuranosyltransferase